MASPDNGTYWIVSAANTALRIDVSGGAVKDGANIQIYTANTGNAQVFNVQSANDGGREIVSRYSGKAIDVAGGSISAGTNVQQWKRNNTRAQSWEAVESGSGVTISGTTYQTYQIVLHADNTLAMQAAGTTSGSNVTIETATGATSQLFAFVPLPAYVDGGVYEIHSMLDPKMVLDVASGSTTNGANIQLYTSNGTNAQKFAIYDEGNGYSIRNIQSDMFVDVAGGKATTSGTNVQQYTDNDTRAQRWSMTQYGTTAYRGVQCPVVEFGAGNGTVCLMDVSQAKTTNETNIQIYTANHTNAQKFILYRVDTTDPKIPAPSNISLNAETAQAYASAFDGDSVTLAVEWLSPYSWDTSGVAHFEHTISRRYMSRYGEWGDWETVVDWRTSLVEMRATSNGAPVAVLPYALTHTMDKETEQSVQWQVSVRSVTDKSTGTYPANVHGGAATGTITLNCEPAVTFGDATWSPLGLRVPYETDWDISALMLHVESDYNKEYDHVGRQSGTIVVPYQYLTDVPPESGTMTLSYVSGTAQMARFANSRAATINVTHTKGTVQHGYTTDGYRKLISIRVADGTSGIPQAWLYYGGKLVALKHAKVNGEYWPNLFEIPYPMKQQYRLYYALGNAVGYDDMEPEPHEIAAWTMDGMSYYAPLVIAKSLKRGIEQDAARWHLDSRAETYVSFGPTRDTSISIDVRLFGLDGEMSLDDALSLTGNRMAVRTLSGAPDCLFRAPDGTIDRVAVESVSQKKVASGVYDLTISMTKVGE